MGVPSPVRFHRFGAFQLDLRARELRRNGVKIRVPDQSIEVLAMLLERPGDVVMREELHHRLWPNGTIVEFDHSINAAIKRLRQALEDSAEEPRYIETLPRLGYRFIASVEVPQAPVVERSHRRLFNWFAGVLAATAVGAALAWFLTHGEPEDGIEPVPVTTYPGAETVPTLSPDGAQVAFTWDGERRDNWDIYVKRIGSEAVQRLTTDPALDFGAAWSPDGRFIAFLRPLTPEKTGVFLISPAGGPEQRVGEVDVVEDFLVGPYLAWSRDSKWLFTVDKLTAAPYFISLLSIESGEKRRLTQPPKGADGDLYPAVSLDGGKLAFTRFGPGPINTLFTLSLGSDQHPTEEPKPLFSDDRWIAPSSWIPGGREILFSLGRGFAEEPMVWRIPVSGRATPRRLGFAGAGSCCATFSGDGRRLVYSRISCPTNLYRLDLRGSVTSAPTKLASSTRISGEPDFSPDGGRIVFVSSRSGDREIWVCDQDGRNLVKLTSFGAHELDYPRWSPDGQQIVFSMRRRGSRNSDIFTVRADGGGLSRLTTGPANHENPQWSRDGHWIYFGSDRTGEMEVWKMRPGGLEQAQVTAHGGSAPQEAADGGFLYFLKPAAAHGEASSLWKLPLRGGAEIRILEETIWAWNYAVTQGGVYYVPVDFGPVGVSGSKIKFLDSSSGRTLHVASAAHWPMAGLAVSPDERYIVDCEADMLAADVMMVENFR